MIWYKFANVSEERAAFRASVICRHTIRWHSPDDGRKVNQKQKVDAITQESTLIPVGVCFKNVGNTPPAMQVLLADPNPQPHSWWLWLLSVVRWRGVADERGVRGEYPEP
jgi:hypothetical protein